MVAGESTSFHTIRSGFLAEIYRDFRFPSVWSLAPLPHLLPTLLSSAATTSSSAPPVFMLPDLSLLDPHCYHPMVFSVVHVRYQGCLHLGFCFLKFSFTVFWLGCVFGYSFNKVQVWCPSASSLLVCICISSSLPHSPQHIGHMRDWSLSLYCDNNGFTM